MRDGIAIAYVPAYQLDVGICRIGLLGITVDLFEQAIQNPHAISAAQQFRDKVSADETGAASDQDMLRHYLPHVV